MSLPLPSPLGLSHPINKGCYPVYVYDPAPLGGRHVNQQSIAENGFGAEASNRHGRSGNSYALPTTKKSGLPMPMTDLMAMIRDFCQQAGSDRRHAYHVTRIGGCRTGAFIDERKIAEAFIENDPGNLHLAGTWERLRTPTCRRICLVSPFSSLGATDLEAIEMMTKRMPKECVEVVAPGVPLQHQPAMDLAKSLGRPARLFSVDSLGLTKVAPLIEGLVWYCDFALIIKPGDTSSLSGMELRAAKRLEVFYKSLLENKVGYRSLTAGAGLYAGAAACPPGVSA